MTEKIVEVIKLTDQCTIFLMPDGYYTMNGGTDRYMYPESAINLSDKLFEYEKTEALQALQKLQL